MERIFVDMSPCNPIPVPEREGLDTIVMGRASVNIEVPPIGLRVRRLSEP
jgi:hypothetical protein